ncbi:hypothetical protein H6F38_19955 [Paenibacillus sp. EKM208P]|nr:hypothetical protein H6F38_19955 [Paenibacillus sp. EKM208P]
MIKKICITAIIFLLFIGTGQVTYAAKNLLKGPEEFVSSVGNLRDIARTSSGMYVAVGTKGTILRSSDGKKWDKYESIPGGYLNAVVANKNVLYAVGEDGIILKSTDGNKWNKQKFIVQKTYGDLIGSKDILDYTRKNDKAAFNLKYQASDVTLTDLIYTGKNYVAIGKVSKKGPRDYYYTAQVAVVSSDGENWQIRKINITNMAKGSMGNIRDLNAIAYSGNRYVVVGDGTILTSTDLLNWKTVSPGIKGSTLYDVIYHNKQWITVGWNGNLTTKDGLRGVIYTSIDGVTWKTIDNRKFVNMPLQAISWTGEQYLVSGMYGLIVYSINGSDWNTSPSIDQLSVKYGGLSQWAWEPHVGKDTDINRIYSDSDGIFGIGFGGTVLKTPDQLNWEVLYPITN